MKVVRTTILCKNLCRSKIVGIGRIHSGFVSNYYRHIHLFAYFLEESCDWTSPRPTCRCSNTEHELFMKFQISCASACWFSDCIVLVVPFSINFKPRKIDQYSLSFFYLAEGPLNLGLSIFPSITQFPQNPLVIVFLKLCMKLVDLKSLKVQPPIFWENLYFP